MVLGSSPVAAVTSSSDFGPASSKEFLDIQATIDCGFTLKRVCDMLCNVFLLTRNRSIAKLSAMKDHCALFSLRLIKPIPNKSRCLKMLPKDSKPQSLQKPEMTTDHEDHASLIKLIYIIQMFQYQKKQVHHIQKIKLFV